jgi:hypothetical protein
MYAPISFICKPTHINPFSNLLIFNYCCPVKYKKARF